MNNTSSNPLNTLRVSSLKGIGEKTEKLFRKVRVDNLNQLLHYYPRAYDVFEEPVDVTEARAGARQSVSVTVTAPPVVNRKGRVPVTVLNCRGIGKNLDAVWYNMPYLTGVLKKGARLVLRGNVIKKGSRLVLEHPQVFTKEEYEQNRAAIQPVYGLTAGLSNKTVSKAVRQVLDRYVMQEYLPSAVLEEYGLAGRDEAVTAIHFPKDEETLRKARRRLVFDEFLLFRLGLFRLKSGEDASVNHYPMGKTSLTGKLLDSLPYKLTGAQEKAWQEIEADMTGSKTMKRLVQGDVGSGKTILAFLAMVLAFSNGVQAAMMAPTEVLARQHADSFAKMMSNAGIKEINCALLLGSTPAKVKKEIYKGLEDGSIHAVIGTHALFQEKAVYKKLGLVITDEQHRFGVAQRSVLSEKGDIPHSIVMSATPIPRTLALILYGDMDMSVLDEMPANRIPVKNAVVGPEYRKTAYKFIEKQVAAGHQAYVICPMVEPNEEFPVENVTDYSKALRKIFPKDISVDVLHGQMPSADKNEIMQKFADGQTDVLVATTVVEVGLDVSNATVILIENADRFGLAQLHQLRGRVGRGADQSYCIFIKSDSEGETPERLSIIESSNDGFAIAREDLKIRGQGDLFGLRQSGESGFLLADPLQDGQILLDASKAAEEILEKDPSLNLPEHEMLSFLLKEQAETDNLEL